MPTISTSCGTLAYDSRGGGDPIVLLPSGGHSRHDYDEVRDLLPGAGAVLAGNSIGANVAARLAISRPELVKGLIIIDGGGFESSTLPARVFCSLMSRPGFVRRIYPAFSRVYTRPRTAADHRARADAIATTRTAAGLAAVTGIWHSFNHPEHNLRAQAHLITAPTVVVWGRRDPVLPLRVGETTRELIAGARLVVIDSGHLPHTTGPAAVAAELTALADAAFGNDGRDGDGRASAAVEA